MPTCPVGYILDGGLRLFVDHVGQRLAVDLLGALRQRRVPRRGVSPRHVQYRVGELAAVLLVELADPEEYLRQDILVQAAVSGRWQGGVLPLQPARRVDEGAVFLGKAGAGQPVDRGLDGSSSSTKTP